MRPTRAYRLSGCLAAIGYVLIVPAVLMLMLALLLTVAGLAVKGPSSVETDAEKQAKARAVARLRAIPNLPIGVVPDFEEDGIVGPASLAGLTTQQRDQIAQVVSEYRASVVGTRVGSSIFGGLVGTALALPLYVVALPVLAIGLLLARRKKVWRCDGCGWYFERL